jgi:hypothetical protein
VSGPGVVDGEELRDVTVYFAESVDWNRYTGTVSIHESGWVEIPELQRLFPPHAITEIQN